MGRPLLLEWASAGRKNTNWTRHYPGIAVESFRCGSGTPAIDGRRGISIGILTALNFLRQQGFKYLKSVKGGISAWSEEIDSKVPRY